MVYGANKQLVSSVCEDVLSIIEHKTLFQPVQRSVSPFTSIEVAQLYNHFTSQLPRKSKQQTLPRWHVPPPLCLAYATERRTLRGQPGLATASRQRRDTPSRAVDSSAKQSYSCAVACRAGDDVASRHTSRIDLLDRYFTQ